MPEKCISGRYFAPGRSRLILVTMSLRMSGFEIHDQDGTLIESGRLESLRLEPEVVGLPSKARMDNGGLFETDDRAAFHAVLGPDGADIIKSRWQGNISRKRWAVIFLLSLLIPPIAWFGYPVLADSLARSLPRSVDRHLGAAIVNQMDGIFLKPSSVPATRQEEIQQIFDELVGVLNVPDGHVRLEFRASPLLGANAIALPDGTVFLLDDLVWMARHDDEIAAVLAHEIAHINERHALRRIARAVGISVLITAVIGETSSIIEEIASVGAGLWELSHSREFELEADSIAGDAMSRSGRDPQRLVDLLRRIDADCGVECEETGIFSTHPGMRDRLEALDGSR